MDNYHENFSFIVTLLTSQSNDGASQNESKLKFQWRKPRLVSFSQNKLSDEPEWRCWPGSPLYQPIWFHVVHRYVFILV